MAKITEYQVEITTPAQARYQKEILTYLLENYSLERAIEIDENIFQKVLTLSKLPNRGRDEDFHIHSVHDSKYILFNEFNNLEIKIIYFIEEEIKKVYVTDFFPTEMNPSKLKDRN